MHVTAVTPYRQSRKEERSCGSLKARPSGCRSSSGRQFGVFGFGGDEDGDAGVGVFPEREEIVVGGAGFGARGFSIGTLHGLSLKRVGAGEAEMRERADGLVVYSARPAEDFLELGRGFPALMRGKIRFPAHIDRIQSGRKTPAARRSQLEGSGGLKNLNGLRRIIANERKLRTKRWQVVELHKRIFGEPLGQIIAERL